MSRNFVRLSAAAFVVATAACAPVNTYSGFSAERNNVQIADPQVGVDTRETVQQRFGSPSTTAVFDQTAWYYVSQTQEQVAFYRPRITQRQVMVVRFNGETVTAVEKYGMERGRLVAYDSHETPTRGRELGIIEQLFGNIGTTPPIRGEEDQQGGRR
ncbi:outer membrane protein assembly factor BamE [Terricaulis sp.]|uniref:outer membrane protein assembly factor BamE n=1 Tax=Terricaulis sp. TaxID=2768686 RepID=UPI003783158B